MKDELNQDPSPKLVAFYLPQYHPVPENDEWWGRGFTEWTNVTKAVPQFQGHYQPSLPADLGFYDLRLPEVRDAQAELARQYGIYGFCYYFYWFNGRRILERPLNEVLQSGKPDFPFCICWANENWTRRWDGLEQEILLEQKHSIDEDNRFIFDILPILQDPRYIRVNGQPLLLVYRPDFLEKPAETAAFWKQACKEAGLPGLHLCAVEYKIHDPRPLGFDALVEFPPHVFPPKEITAEVELLNPNFSGLVFDYYWGVKQAIQREAPPFTLYRGVMPSWDNTARRSEKATVFHYATPEIYRQWLHHTISQASTNDNSNHESFVFINAWNEWAEGTVLEPSQRYGRQFLEATLQAGDPVEYPTARVDQEADQAYSKVIAAHSKPIQINQVSSLGVKGRLKKSLNRIVVTLMPKLEKLKWVWVNQGARGTFSFLYKRLASSSETRGGGISWAGPHFRQTASSAILFVSHDAGLAGAQLILLENIKHFVRLHNLDCYLLLCQGGELEYEFQSIVKTCKLTYLIKSGLSRSEAIRLVIEDIKGRSPLMAFCNTVATGDVAEACYQADIPVLASIYELPASIETYIGRTQLLKLVNHAKCTVVASDYVGEELAKYYHLEPNQFTTIHAGVRAQPQQRMALQEARDGVLKELKLPGYTCLVLGCGSVHHRKGTDLFVQVAQQVFEHPGMEHVRFVWIGADQDGPTFRQWCEHDIRMAGLEDKVLLIGQRPENQVGLYFMAADIFSLTSREDPFPLVNLEAMSYGLPVVAFRNAGGAPEALLPEAGIVVPYLDAAAMAQAIVSLVKDEALRQRLGIAAAEKCTTQYQWSRYADDFVSLMKREFGYKPMVNR